MSVQFVTVTVKCKRCNGTGEAMHGDIPVCAHCHGKGEYQVARLERVEDDKEVEARTRR